MVTETEQRGRAGGGGTKKGKSKGEAGASGGDIRGRGKKKEPVGRVCVYIRGSLRVGRCRLVLAPITSVTGVTVGWSRH